MLVHQLDARNGLAEGHRVLGQWQATPGQFRCSLLFPNLLRLRPTYAKSRAVEA
jgi:hypothetical protein